MGPTFFPHWALVSGLADLGVKTRACQKPTEQKDSVANFIHDSGFEKTPFILLLTSSFPLLHWSV